MLTCVACERVDTDEEQAAAGLGRRPFMMLGTESLHSPGSAGTDWPGACGQLAGWGRRLTVTGAGHFSFTDLPYLADQLGLSDPAVPLSAEQGWRISVTTRAPSSTFTCGASRNPSSTAPRPRTPKWRSAGPDPARATRPRGPFRSPWFMARIGASR
ncbi:hypothetical protein EDD93_4933 [Streptomyces sp. 840.1]|nr:hypothetical protein EDD93_4933 [Streptomyces sp. 840.1]